MKQGLHSQAFTIIEVLMVLAVTGALLISAIALISGQQRKTEFSQAITNIDSQIKDVINDVSTGFYNNTGNFVCSSSGSGPVISVGTNNQGSNQGCIFIGRAMQFSVGGNGENFNVYNIVGQRQVSSKEVTSLDDAKPKAIAPDSGSSTGFPDSTETKTLQYGLSAKTMKYTNGGTAADTAVVVFMSSLAQYSSSTGDLISGSQATNLMPVVGTTLVPVTTATQAVDKINILNSSSIVNPDGGIAICFQSGGTNQYGIITIGSNARQLSTTLSIQQGNCP